MKKLVAESYTRLDTPLHYRADILTTAVISFYSPVRSALYGTGSLRHRLSKIVIRPTFTNPSAIPEVYECNE